MTWVWVGTFGYKNGKTTIVAFSSIYIIYKWLYVYIGKQSSTLLSVNKTVRFLGEKLVMKYTYYC